MEDCGILIFFAGGLALLNAATDAFVSAPREALAVQGAWRGVASTLFSERPARARPASAVRPWHSPRQRIFVNVVPCGACVFVHFFVTSAVKAQAASSASFSALAAGGAVAAAAVASSRPGPTAS